MNSIGHKGRLISSTNASRLSCCPVVEKLALDFSEGALSTLALLLLFLAGCGVAHFSQPFGRVHAAPAIAATAVAGRLVLAVVEAVVVGQFFAGGNVANAFDVDAPVLLVGFAVGIAGVIDEHGHAMTVDHHLAIPYAKKIGEGATIIAIITLGLGDAFAGVFQHARPFGNVVQREASSGMNVGGTNDKARQGRLSTVM